MCGAMSKQIIKFTLCSQRLDAVFVLCKAMVELFHMRLRTGELHAQLSIGFHRVAQLSTKDIKLVDAIF